MYKYPHIILRDGTRVLSVSCADAIVLVASTPDGLQALLDAAFADSRRNVYRFSTDKRVSLYLVSRVV